MGKKCGKPQKRLLMVAPQVKKSGRVSPSIRISQHLRFDPHLSNCNWANATLAQLKACRSDLIDPGLARHRGRIVKTSGDGLLIEFSSPVEAVRWAVEAQQGMIERNATVPDDKYTLVSVHSLANAAMIHLYNRLGQDDPTLYDKSLGAAHACVHVIKYISNHDFNFCFHDLQSSHTLFCDDVFR